MTALTHAVVVSLPDNPSYEVSKNAWNQAHPLPGTIGQLFASDGASGVDAIPQLVYNSTTGSFNVAVDSALGGVFQIFDVQGTRGMFAFDPNAGNLSADKLMPVTALSGLLDLGGPANLWKDVYVGNSIVLGATPFTFSETAGVLQLGTDKLTIAAANGNITSTSGDGPVFQSTGTQTATPSSPISVFLTGTDSAGNNVSGLLGMIDSTDTVIGLGAQNTANASCLYVNNAGKVYVDSLGGGYVAPAQAITTDGGIRGASFHVGASAGADGTVSGADLAAQSLSFVKGIYVGLV